MSNDEHLRQRHEQRQKHSNALELIIAELEDMKTHHHSLYFKVSVGLAIKHARDAQNKLLSLNKQFEKLANR
jgi:hypothetical protein